MDNFNYSEIGRRLKALRKRKGLNQQELAELLGKSLRTVQKYETGEIEVSIAIVNQLAEILESTPTYILGYEVKNEPITNLADIMNLLFQLEKVQGLDFRIEVKKPPRNARWECSVSFDGKNTDADYNADMCLFLEQWEEQRDDLRTYNSSPASYRKWQEQTLAYYAATSVDCTEPEDISEEERRKRRIAYMESLYADKKGET